MKIMISIIVLEVAVVFFILLGCKFYTVDLRKEKDMLKEKNNLLSKENSKLTGNIKSLENKNSNLECKLKETISKKEYEHLLIILKAILSKFTNKEIILDYDKVKEAKNGYIHIEDMEFEFAKRVKLILKQNILKEGEDE